MLLHTALVLIVLLVVALAALLGMICWQEANPPKRDELGDYGAIVVLGAQVKEDGTPSVQLEWRLEEALAMWREKPCLIVCCGAQGVNEPASEGDVMRQWFIDRGVPADQVVSDPDSFNTKQNIEHAARIVAPYGVTRVLIITSDYHLPRAMALAGDLGLEATGVGSPCKNDIVNWTRNHGRETLSWVKYLLQKYLRLPLE